VGRGNHAGEWGGKTRWTSRVRVTEREVLERDLSVRGWVTVGLIDTNRLKFSACPQT
jgi:hypothetical protein